MTAPTDTRTSEVERLAKTFDGDPGGPTCFAARVGSALRTLTGERDALQTEVERLSALVYVPGLWRCAKCSFALHQRALNARDGSVTARDEPGEKCPNCDVPLWRVTERDAGNEMIDRADEEIAARKAAEDRLKHLAETLRHELDRGLVHWVPQTHLRGALKAEMVESVDRLLQSAIAGALRAPARTVKTAREMAAGDRVLVPIHDPAEPSVVEVLRIEPVAGLAGHAMVMGLYLRGPIPATGRTATWFVVPQAWPLKVVTDPEPATPEAPA